MVLGVVLGWPASVGAAPRTSVSSATALALLPAEASEPAAEEAVPGDLRAAADEATAAREADPSPANWHREGEALEDLGDYEGAAQAYQGELDALPADDEAAREAARGDLQRMRDASRGRVADEPASTHRKELDEKWAPPKREKKAKPKPKVAVEPTGDPKDRIVRKWYFWVTVVAIVASAAAVTGIAIKASRDERKDALSLGRNQGGMQGPALFRF